MGCLYLHVHTPSRYSRTAGCILLEFRMWLWTNYPCTSYMLRVGYLIIMIGIWGQADSAVNFCTYPPFIQAPAYIRFSVYALLQSPKPWWWGGGAHDRMATGIEPATCRSQEERPPPQTTRPSGPREKRTNVCNVLKSGVWLWTNKSCISYMCYEWGTSARPRVRKFHILRFIKRIMLKYGVLLDLLNMRFTQP